MFTTRLIAIGGLVLTITFSILLYQRNSARSDLAQERKITAELNSSLAEVQNALQHEKTAVNNLNDLIKGKDLELKSLSKKTKELLQNEACNSTDIPSILYEQLQHQYSH